MKDLAYRIEELENEAERLHSVALAVEEAIFSGMLEYSVYEAAMWTVVTMANELHEHLHDATKNAFDIIRCGDTAKE